MFRALILAAIASLGIHFGCSDEGAESPVNNPANNPSGDMGMADMAEDSGDDSGAPDSDSGPAQTSAYWMRHVSRRVWVSAKTARPPDIRWFAM